MTGERKDAEASGSLAADLPYRLDWRAAGVRIGAHRGKVEGSGGLFRDFDTLIIDDIRREPALVLMDHIGRMTTAAPPSFRRKLARFFSIQ